MRKMSREPMGQARPTRAESWRWNGSQGADHSNLHYDIPNRIALGPYVIDAPPTRQPYTPCSSWRAYSAWS
jgi:hypothetical protein